MSIETERAADVRPYYYGIDLVRFASALLVTLFHLGYSTWATPHGNGALYSGGVYCLPDLAPFTWVGWLGVEIFFVISGLVIASSAANATPASFLRSRILRLYPGLWLCAALTVVFRMLAGRPPGPWAMAVSFLLIPGGRNIDGQYWTLGVEFCFYALVWLVLASGSFRRIEPLAFGMALLSAVAVTLAIWKPAVAALVTTGPARALPIYYGSFFALGIALRQLASGRRTAMVLVTGAVALAGAVAEIWHHAPNLSTRLGFNYSPAIPVTIFLVAVLVMLAFTQRPQVIDRLPGGALGAIRSLGLATYPLYLIHFAPGVLLIRWQVERGVEPHLALATTVIGLCLAALLIARYGERPLRGAMARLIPAPRPRPAAA